ncbi:MAG: hypothetical protein N2688_13525, partial [Burkholderiaceae bacterium]|nr:hypothetical protein [Burkholderiaceae bacterium]
SKVVPPQVEHAVDLFHSAADLPLVRAACEQNPSPLSRLLLVVIADAEHLPAALAGARETALRIDARFG